MRNISRMASLECSIGLALLVSSTLVGLARDGFAADGWSYTRMNTTPLGSSPGGVWLPAINNAGQVVYASEEEIEPGSWREGIHVSDGVSDQTVLEFIGPRGSLLVSRLGLDDSGNVAFLGRIPGEAGTLDQLYRVGAGQAVRIPIDLPEFVYRAGADLNEMNELALLRWTFGGDNQILIRRIESSGPFQDRSANMIFNYSPPEAPALNDAGDIAFFIGEQGSGIPGFYRIRYQLWRRATENVEEYTLSTPEGANAPAGEAGFNNLRFASSIALGPSLSGRLLFWAPTGVDGVMPGVVALIDTNEPGSAISQLAPGSSMSNNNVVAFAGAETGSGTDGIFVRSPSGETIPVVRSGESVLEGSGPVGSFPLANDILRTRSLNEQGQLTFLGVFDGVWQVVRAEAAPGLLPDLPVLPDPEDYLPGGGWDLGRGQCGGVSRCWFDPPLAVGYRFTIAESSAGAIADVTIPAPLPQGDALFAAEFNGVTVPLVAGTPLDFSVHTNEPVREFVITGIDEAETLDAEDPTAFVTGLTFAAGSSPDLRFSMVPVPEPGIALGSLAGLFWLRALGRRRPR